MMKTIQAHIDEKLAKLEAQLWKDLAKQVDVKAVNQMLKDDMLFEDSDEYMMTDEEYEESEFYDEDNGYGY
jgi:hypothetical protein